MLFIQMQKGRPEVYAINNDGEVEGVQLTALKNRLNNTPAPIELSDLTLTHRWEAYPKTMGSRPDHYRAHEKVFPKYFNEIYSLYKERVGDTGLTFEQWLSVLPGLGSGSLPVDYLGLYRCSQDRLWLVSIHRCKLQRTEITENVMIVDYAIHPMRELVENARQKAQAALDLIDSYGPKVLSDQFLGDISYRVSETSRMPIADFIIEALLKR